jgi:hypothetical protein
VRITVVACEVLFREVCLCAARAKTVIDLTFLRRGLHSNPDQLREALQQAIAQTDEAQGEAVALGYGLCSNGVAGLRARGRPLVIPRAHDCITLLLGSREAYDRVFSARPGTYYYSGGWIERGADTVPRTPEDGQGLEAPFEELVAKYGRDNAEYLWELQASWIANYTHAAHIDTALGDLDGYRAHTRQVASDRGWQFEELPGDLALLQALLDGEWDEERFLVVPPGHEVTQKVGSEVMASRP